MNISLSTYRDADYCVCFSVTLKMLFSRLLVFVMDYPLQWDNVIGDVTFTCIKRTLSRSSLEDKLPYKLPTCV